MHIVNMLEAKSTLSKLVEAIQSGNEEVVIPLMTFCINWARR